MLGRWAAEGIDLAESIAMMSTTTLAKSTAVAIEATSRIALPIPIRPYLVRRRSAKAHASSRDELILTQVG
jgi:hypothetical protein